MGNFYIGGLVYRCEHETRSELETNIMMNLYTQTCCVLILKNPNLNSSNRAQRYQPGSIIASLRQNRHQPIRNHHTKSFPYTKAAESIPASSPECNSAHQFIAHCNRIDPSPISWHHCAELTPTPTFNHCSRIELNASISKPQNHSSKFVHHRAFQEHFQISYTRVLKATSHQALLRPESIPSQHENYHYA